MITAILLFITSRCVSYFIIITSFLTSLTNLKGFAYKYYKNIGTEKEGIMGKSCEKPVKFCDSVRRHAAKLQEDNPGIPRVYPKRDAFSVIPLVNDLFQILKNLDPLIEGI